MGERLRTTGDTIAETARFVGETGLYVALGVGAWTVGAVFPRQVQRLEARLHPAADIGLEEARARSRLLQAEAAQAAQDGRGAPLGHLPGYDREVPFTEDSPREDSDRPDEEQAPPSWRERVMSGQETPQDEGESMDEQTG